MSEEMDSGLESQPDLEDVLQESPEHISVPVRHDGPVHTHELPASNWSAFNTTITDTSVEKLFGKDPRRKRVVLIALDAAFIAGEARNSVTQGAATVWPQNVPLEFRHSGEIYVRCRFAGSILLSVFVEYWAD